MVHRLTARRSSALISGAMVCMIAGGAAAAENATSVYLLGFRGPLAGMTPPPGVFLQNDVYVYGGSADGGRRLLLGGTLAANVNGEAQLELPTVIWVAPAQVLAASWASRPHGRSGAVTSTREPLSTLRSSAATVASSATRPTPSATRCCPASWAGMRASSIGRRWRC